MFLQIMILRSFRSHNFLSPAAFVRNVRWELRTEEFANKLVTPIMRRFDDLQPPHDRLTIPLFECLQALVEEMGEFFLPLTPKVVRKCVQNIEECQQQEQQFAQNPNASEVPNRDICNTSIDLLSSVCEGFGPNLQRQVLDGGANFVPILETVLGQNGGEGWYPGTMQCAFALMGTCSKHCSG